MFVLFVSFFKFFFSGRVYTEPTFILQRSYNLPREGELEADLNVKWGEGGQLESNGAKGWIIYNSNAVCLYRRI